MDDKLIIHVDMDAFYAAVEVRDDPSLAGKPLIIGALPSERGVVSTCSYEARKFGVRSAMSVKEAYRRCPQGIYMHPNMAKYKRASDAIHEIWGSYTDLVEYISLDEGFLDVTASAHMFGGAESIGREIKRRTKRELGLDCSVGISYCMTGAKIASEEDKPDGFFVIPDRQAFRDLMIDRKVGAVYTVGQKTAEKLEQVGIHTVRDILRHEQRVIDMLGKHGRHIVDLANGIDRRDVTPYFEAEAKSIGREHTFQTDISDFDYLEDALRLIARALSRKLRLAGIYCQTITLKITYGNMKKITRSQTGPTTNQSADIFRTASALLRAIDRAPVRLIGISLGNLTESNVRQLSLDDMAGAQRGEKKERLSEEVFSIEQKYGPGIIKTAMELKAEQRLKHE